MTTTQKLQKIIDETRTQYGQGAVMVSHYEAEEGGFDETTISLSFDKIGFDECFELGYKISDIVGGCDSGAGFGYRDLQLCKLFPELK